MTGAQPVWVEAGHGVRFQLRELGEARGVAYEHPRPDTGAVCAGYAPIGEPEGWALEQVEPVTLSPSLLCRGCGHHGFLRDGQWVPA